jgi:hypothetical protein
MKEQSKQRGLSRPAGTDQKDELTFLDLQVDVNERFDVPGKRLVNMEKLDHVRVA